MKSNIRDSIDNDAHGKLNNNNSDSGVFTSESSKENEEKESAHGCDIHEAEILEENFQ